MVVNSAQVLDSLRRIKGPDLEGNIVDLGLVSDVLIKDGRAYFSITIDPARAAELEPLRKAAETVVAELEGIKSVAAVLTAQTAGPRQGAAPEHSRVQQARAHGTAGDGAGRAAAASAPAPRRGTPVAGVRHIIAVASGKGGVGKSTTAVNLALGFQAIGLKVGILDADIYGPSQPRLLGLTGKPRMQGNRLMPMMNFGIKVMSMGFLVDEGTPIVWRGPMVISALNQMMRDVAWGDPGDELDVLVIDMPPGTGDVQLSIAQQVPLSGAVIVSTPQDLALIDARKGIAMFKQVDVPILGLVENMSYFLCPKCGERTDIFGHGGARAEAERLGVTFLGGVPLHMEIRSRSDSGQPITATAPDSLHAGIFRDIAAKTWAGIGAAQGQRSSIPRLEPSAAKDALEITFEDGSVYGLSAELLRVMSPSAEVQGHSPDQRVTVARKRNVKIKALEPVGNYAVRIVFDDGHSTGLYAWSYLRLLGEEKNKRWAAYLRELDEKGLSRG